MKSSRLVPRFAHRTLGTAALVVCLAGALNPVAAYEYNDHRFENPGPSAEAMFMDTFVARPLGFVATVGGTALYVLSLPFSVAGGNEAAARQRLVHEPSNYTFQRCLGCAWGERPLYMGQTYDNQQAMPAYGGYRQGPPPAYQQRSAYPPPPRGYYK